MNRLPLSLTCIFLSAQAQANLALGTYPTSSKDSVEISTLYGIQAFHNEASKVSLEVVDGLIRLVADTIASDGDKGHSANVGLVHSISPDGSEHDLSNYTHLQFEYRDDQTITEQHVLSFGSPVYPDSVLEAGLYYKAIISSIPVLKGDTSWRTMKVPMADFVTWFGSSDIPLGYPPLLDVLKRVVNIRIQPMSTYTAPGMENGAPCEQCVTPSRSRLRLEIRNIALLDTTTEIPPAKDSTGMIDTLLPKGVCNNPAVSVLDTTFDNATNQVKGEWGVFTDCDQTRTSPQQTEGSSRVELTYHKAVGGVSSGKIDVLANLDNRVGEQTHDLAGWGGVQTAVCGDQNYASEISFHVKVDSMPSNVLGIRFRLTSFRKGDTASVFLPANALRNANGGDFCVRPVHMRGLKGRPYNISRFTDFRFLMWDVRISRDAAFTTPAAKVQFSVSKVRLYDFFQTWMLSTSSSSGCRSGAIEPRSPSGQPKVSYAHGVLEFGDLDGIAKLDILGLDGRLVASFAPKSSIPLRLSRGTWILAAHRRDGTVATQPFTVLDR